MCLKLRCGFQFQQLFHSDLGWWWHWTVSAACFDVLDEVLQFYHLATTHFECKLRWYTHISSTNNMIVAGADGFRVILDVGEEARFTRQGRTSIGSFGTEWQFLHTGVGRKCDAGIHILVFVVGLCGAIISYTGDAHHLHCVSPLSSSF